MYLKLSLSNQKGKAFIENSEKIGCYFSASRGLSEIQELVINDVSPDEVAAGVFAGEFNQYRWTYRVNVTVQDGKTVDLQFDKGGTLEQEFAERIITKQSLDVGINIGTTVNRNAFLKAVEKALNGL